MRINKKSIKNIKLRDRHFNFWKLHDAQMKYLIKQNKGKKVKKSQLKLIDELYVGVLEAHDEETQIYRDFSVTEQRTLEIERIYYQINLEPLIMRYGAYMNWYSYRLNYNTKFDFRSCIRVIYYPHEIEIKGVIPKFKKYINKRALRNIDIYNYLYFLSLHYENPSVESLASIDLKQFCMFYESQISNYDFLNTCERFLRPLQLINKWGYKVKDFTTYIDHLNLVDALGLDLHSPKYIAPKDLEKAHQQLINLQNKRKDKITKGMENEYHNIINKYKLKDVDFDSKDFIIKPILSVKEVKDEALEQHNCLFRNKYYKKPNTLLFTSFDKKQNKLETIEYNIISEKIIQSHGLNNIDTDLHDNIVDWGSKQITNYIRRLKLC